MEKLNCSVYEITDSVEKILADGALLPLYVSGSSMNPFLISRRDIVYLNKICDSDFKKEKIILFKRSNGNFVLHRIKKVLPDGILLMNGDAQTWTETVNKKQVIAVVSEIERKGKRKSAESLYWRAVNCFWSFLSPFRSLIMRVWFKVRRIKNNNHSE